MAKSGRKRSTRRSGQTEYPGWLWMLFGLAIGLSVAFAIYVRDRAPDTPVTAAKPATQPPASLVESDAGTAVPEEQPESAEDRFAFYKMLPAFEVLIADEEPAVDQDIEPHAIEEPGLYLLQAGSFSTHSDADRRRAELAMQGIESRVQRARVNNRDYYRVYVGPIEDLDVLNVTRSRLREAKIDVMRIRLGD